MSETSRMLRNSLFFLAILFSFSVHAFYPVRTLGGMDSGGGRGLVCFSDTSVTERVRKHQGMIEEEDLGLITSIEPIDLYEARQKRGPEVRLPQLAMPINGENHLEYLERLVLRTEEAFPTLGEKVRKSELEFNSDNLIWQDVGLFPVMDENTTGNYNSASCTLTTMAVQFKEEGQNYLAIDHRLFFHPQHSTMGRAVLLLHEYLYLVARKAGRSDSRSTRLAIGLLLRNEDNLNLVSMEKALVDLNFISPDESLGERPNRPLNFPVLY